MGPTLGKLNRNNELLSHKLTFWPSYTLYCQKYSDTSLDSHMNFSNIPFFIHWVYYDSVLPFVATTASALQWRLSARFRSVFMGMLDETPGSVSA